MNAEFAATVFVVVLLFAVLGTFAFIILSLVRMALRAWRWSGRLFSAGAREQQLAERQSATSGEWISALPRNVLFVDVETTGLDPANDRIVCLAALLLETESLRRGELALRSLHLIFNPRRKCHPQAIRKHGYTDRILSHQQPFEELLETICPLFDEADLIVAHNAEFDVAFLNSEFSAHGRWPLQAPIYCTMQNHRRQAPRTRATLEACAALCGLQRENEMHAALEDAWLAMMIYLRQHGCPHAVPYAALASKRPANFQPERVR